MEPGAPDWQIFGRTDAATGTAPVPTGPGPRATRRIPLPALIAGGIALLLGVGSVGLALAGAPDATLVIDAPDAGAVGASPAPASAEAAGALLIVDVAGAVVTPGLVRLVAGSRVGDALAAAGGFAVGADLVAASAALNLAAPLTDGAQVRVPSLLDAATPALPAAGSPATDGRPDLNLASATDLEALPGIGTVTAERILAARAENPFRSVDELRTRGLVGEATFTRIRDLVRIGP